MCVDSGSAHDSSRTFHKAPAFPSTRFPPNESFLGKPSFKAAFSLEGDTSGHGSPAVRMKEGPS